MRVSMGLAVLYSLVCMPVAAQVVPGAPNTDWDVAHNEFTLGVLREYNGLMNGWREALNDGDVAKALGSYSEGAELLLSGRVRVAGRDSVRAVLSGFAASLVEVRLGLTTFQASDKLAYAAGPLIFSVRDADGAVHPHTGHHVTVLVREGRRWRIQAQVLHYQRTS